MFRNVKLCYSLADVEQLPEPRVVLATQPDLTPGFALVTFPHLVFVDFQDLFMAWAPDTSNRIIFTNKSRPGVFLPL